MFLDQNMCVEGFEGFRVCFWYILLCHAKDIV